MNEPPTDKAVSPLMMVGMSVGVLILIALALFFLKKPSESIAVSTPTPAPPVELPPAPRCPLRNLTISTPTPLQVIKFPFTVKGVVDNRQNKDCTWGVFEAQAGTMVIQDSQGNIVAEGILSTEGEWMTEGPIQVSGVMTAKGQPTDKNWTLIITEDDPSGQGDVQKLSLPVTGE